MEVNELLVGLGACANQLPPNTTSKPTEAVIRCLDMEFPIDCVQVEIFPGNETERPRTVVAIRIEDEDKRELEAQQADTVPSEEQVMQALYATGDADLFVALTYEKMKDGMEVDHVTFEAMQFIQKLWEAAHQQEVEQ